MWLHLGVCIHNSHLKKAMWLTPAAYFLSDSCLLSSSQRLLCIWLGITKVKTSSVPGSDWSIYSVQPEWDWVYRCNLIGKLLLVPMSRAAVLLLQKLWCWRREVEMPKCVLSISSLSPSWFVLVCICYIFEYIKGERAPSWCHSSQTYSIC